MMEQLALLPQQLLEEALQTVPLYRNKLRRGYDQEAKYPLDRYLVKSAEDWEQLTLQDGQYYYVIFRNGEFRFTQDDSIRRGVHSRLADNNEVIAAGEFFLADRMIQVISNESGHYLPFPSSVGVALFVMNFYHVSLSPYIQTVLVGK